VIVVDLAGGQDRHAELGPDQRQDAGDAVDVHRRVEAQPAAGEFLLDQMRDPGVAAKADIGQRGQQLGIGVARCPGRGDDVEGLHHDRGEAQRERWRGRLDGDRGVDHAAGEPVLELLGVIGRQRDPQLRAQPAQPRQRGREQAGDRRRHQIGRASCRERV